MPDFVVNKVMLALNEENKSLKNSNVLVLGVAYKNNVDDVRESPSIFIMEKLRDLGAKVNYSDPHVPSFPKMRKHSFELDSVELTAENLNSFDCVILTTAHEKFDYDLIQKNSKIIVDTRGKFTTELSNVVRA